MVSAGEERRGPNLELEAAQLIIREVAHPVRVQDSGLRLLLLHLPRPFPDGLRADMTAVLVQGKDREPVRLGRPDEAAGTVTASLIY